MEQYHYKERKYSLRFDIKYLIQMGVLTFEKAFDDQ